MRVDVHFTPSEANPDELSAGDALVIDALRATSTIVEALAQGAAAVLPVASVEEARRRRDLDPARTLLCGERGSLRIEGFDLGNSPAEYGAERVAGKLLVMTTTNGTAALLAAAPARRVLVASFLNLSAAAAAAGPDDGRVAIVCAGKERRFALEDALCAGALVLRLLERSRGAVELNDAAAAAATLAQGRSSDLPAALAATAAGRQLRRVGHGADIRFCGMLDRHEVVPRFTDGRITL